MVELYVFWPDEQMDYKEYAEVMLRLPIGRLGDVGFREIDRMHGDPIVLDEFGECIDSVRFAVRRSALNAREPAPVNPLTVACPLCNAKIWDPCRAYKPPMAGVSEITHEARKVLARTPPYHEMPETP